MIKDEWMSTFYGKDWYKIKSADDLENIPECMLEWVVPANAYRDIEIAQDLGFTLVETAIEFETLIDYMDPSMKEIRVATQDDFKVIADITEECYLNNTKFYNRFRNTTFFTRQQALNYYLMSVKNNYMKSDTITVVYEDSLGVAAYYILKHINDFELYGNYKGIIAGVSSRARGNNLHIELQKKLTEIIGRPYMTINRTQLGNYRVIGNHLREHRQLSKIEHYFYKLNR